MMARYARRLFDELRRAPSRRDVDEALARVRLDDAGDTVRLERGAYASIPTREARIEILERARALASGRPIVLAVHVDDDRSHLGRLAFDAPRRLLRAMRVRGVPEPGDRFGEGRFVHCFFDEESLRSEVAAAGLRVARVRADEHVLAVGPPESERPDPFARELSRVLAIAREVERRRTGEPPGAVVRAMRERGAREPARGPIGRARLRRAIGWVDALTPTGPNCYRRTLLELALDAGAARETLVFGLDVGRTGHVAFKGREDRSFDVEYEMPPPGPRDEA